MPRKWWYDNEYSLPTRKLYLNLIEPITHEYDIQNKYDFKFLSESDLEKYNQHSEKYFWFKVGEILDLDTNIEIIKYINKHNLSENEYALEILSQLSQYIHREKLLNYYLEDEQDPDKVLDIFIRTNSGGTPLSFSDLLMSIASANWKELDARKEIEKLVDEIYQIGNANFIINQDFVLKTCLVLFVSDIRFQLKNFTHENINQFEKKWKDIRKGIVSAFKLFACLGFNDKNFRAKNAAIPVIYYIFFNQLVDCISKPTYKNHENKVRIKKWLILSFVKSIFGGQSDVVLKKMRDVLEENKGEEFPDDALISAFKNDPSRNYGFDDEFIDGLLESKKGSNNAHYLLHLLYSHLDLNQELHQDHLHPESIFIDEEKLNANTRKKYHGNNNGKRCID